LNQTDDTAQIIYFNFVKTYNSKILTYYYLTQIEDSVRYCTIPGQSKPDNNDG